MTTTKEVQISLSNVRHVADAINAAVDAGRAVTVNGETPITSFEAHAAHAYKNGTLGFRVAAKAKGKTREVFVKVGHMATITSEAPEDQAPAEAPVKVPKTKKVKFIDEGTPLPEPERPSEPEKAPRPIRSIGDRKPLPATVKGETGWLTVRTVNGKYAYAVTMDEKNASLFRPGPSSERHARRATDAGITVEADAEGDHAAAA